MTYQAGHEGPFINITPNTSYYITLSVNGGPERVIEGENSVPTGQTFSGCTVVRMIPRVTYQTRDSTAARIAVISAEAHRTYSRGSGLLDYIIRESAEQYT